MSDEGWPCVFCEEVLPSRRSLRRHKEFWHPAYTPGEIERLIHQWAYIRARTEGSGDLEDEAWMSVLDLEGALREMASPDLQGRRNLGAQRMHAAAAVAVSAKLLCGFSDAELKMAISPDMDPQRLIRKASHWFATKLAGGTQRDCDEAFRRAG